ncbi:MAG: hypothetical protein KI792_01100 [Alphaproteobacteria bacterium]|nr:hypothetical protein [Alphaproteobacteria bacterium SS10]
MSKYLETSEYDDFLNSVMSSKKFLKLARKNLHYWKWFAVSIHNALQAGMVCHLSGSAGLGANDMRRVKEQLEWHERDRKGEIEKEVVGRDEFDLPVFQVKNPKDCYPDDRLADPKTLLNRMGKQAKRVEHGAGSIIPISQKHLKSWASICSLRNNFVHFSPSGWLIEVDLIKIHSRELIDIIQCIIDDGYAVRHAKPKRIKKAKKSLDVMERILSK